MLPDKQQMPAFRTKTGCFYDTEREREIPYLVYHPDKLRYPYPVILVSHELGGSKESLPYLGKYLADHGYIVFHIQHPGSDESLIKSLKVPTKDQICHVLTESLKDPNNATNRFRDISFVIEQIKNPLAIDKEIIPFLNTDSIGMIGHSYGAYTAMIAAGQHIDFGISAYFTPALKAGVLLSPYPPKNIHHLSEVYQDITIPLLHISGSRDRSPLTEECDLRPIDRILPYENIHAQNQYLLYFEDADHATFSGRRINRRFEKPLDKQHIAAVERSTLSFFHFYLKKDQRALVWLRDMFSKTLAVGDRFEWK